MYPEFNIVTGTDSYKVSHWKQYPEGTTNVFSFLESRGGRYAEVIFFGLQYILKKYFTGCVVTEEKIAEAKDLFEAHFGSSQLFNEAGWRYILTEHKGVLPVRIKAIPEGTKVPVGQAIVTIENTDPNTPWLTNYIETILMQVWYPTTVATQSYYMKQTILQYLEETGTPEDILFKLHDFGYRGSTSVESAGIGGAAHLVNFLGTDTFEAIRVLRYFYNEKMAGFSIPAAEHSTITSWGRSNEGKAFANMLHKYPAGLVAVVSDSYNIYNACENIWGEELKTEVLGRNGTVVIRPDSGEPTEVLPRILTILGEKFGYSVNAKGYKVLNPKVRVIQGDGIDSESVGVILEALKVSGWSADNIAFGSGGGLLQNVNRDTQKFALKCSSVVISGVEQDVYKDPVTDHGKRSKTGRLILVRNADGKFETVREELGGENLLQTVFLNGSLLIDQSLAEIRERARQ